MPRRRAILLPVLLTLGGCSGGGFWALGPPAAPQSDLREGYNAFAPASLRIFPLTHLGLDDQGRPAIICHIELADRWGDSVKALGRLRVTLSRSEGGLGAATARQELAWDVRLDDERTNAEAYDPSTQTYRLLLGGLPPWLAQRATEDAARAPLRLRLDAVFQTLGRNGEEQVLSDGLVLDV
ncbi:MAG: hypothetical protein IPJ41_15010 [Phycisphaerales bacterium]|nr:hypothetical protein [Phycisphaerales bacterium]